MKRTNSSTNQSVRKGATPFLLTALSALLASTFAQSAWAIVPGISEQQTNAIHAIAGLSAESPNRIDPYLQKIGFPVDSMPKDWQTYPVVRKLELAYVSAEKAKPGAGRDVLALVAKDLDARFESVKYEPSLKPLLAVSAKPPLLFQMADLPPPAKLVLEPARRNAIAAISKYSEGGALGGPHGILEHYFNVPAPTAYAILRTANSPEEALVMGLAYVPERERHASLERLVARIDHVYGETSLNEAALKPYRKPEMQLAEAPKLPPFGRPGPNDAASGGGFPPSSPSGGGGGSDFSNRPSPEGPTPTPPSWEPRGPISPRPSPATAGERYTRFVETSYPVESGRAFGRMIGLRAGFGGVVLGNKVTGAPGLAKPTQLTWAPYNFKDGKPVTGEIRIHFSDGIDRVYGPVDAEDVYAAALILKGGGGAPPYVKDEGVGLVSLNGQDERPRLTADNRVVWEDRWNITLHPALARLSLGRSIVLCDAMPIHRDGFLDLLRSNSGPAAAVAVEKVFSEHITNWKLTDAPLQITANGNRISVIRAYDMHHPLSLAYRQQALLSMQGFEQNEDEASEGFTSQFDNIAADVVRSSEHYKRLNSFAAVFGLYRWAQAQGAIWLTTPSEPSLLDPVPPSLILSNSRQFELAGDSTEADVLRRFFQTTAGRFDAIASSFPPALSSVAAQSSSLRSDIQNQQVKLAELEQNLENSRLDFRALSVRLEEKVPLAQQKKRDYLLSLEDAVEAEIRRSSHNAPSAAAGEGVVSSRLVEFAATIDRPIASQLRSVLDEYKRVTLEVASLEKTADESQMRIHQQVIGALLGDESGQYQQQYNQLTAAYRAAINNLVAATRSETTERHQWQNAAAAHLPEMAAILIGMEEQTLDSERAHAAQASSQEDRESLASSLAELKSTLADLGQPAPRYLQAAAVTNQAYLKFGAARRAFAEFLDQRDAALTAKYPNWQTWWALMTCSRHPSTEHLDFDMAVED